MDKKFIYKITNNINGKCYIGQTNDIKTRFATHKAKAWGREPEKTLYKAFDKYGIDNFNFEVIEETYDYNEREKYWIEYYDSYKNGYNGTPGGEGYPILKGEKLHWATHTQQQIDEIKELLKNTSMSKKEIAEKYNYSVGVIGEINSGKIWYDPECTYPLRFEITKNFYKERVNSIIDDLLNTELSSEAISKKYGVSRSTVTMINIGETGKKEDLDYPLRKPIPKRVLGIIEDLQNTNMTKQVISEKYGVTRNTVYSINQGKSYHQNNLDYPLRKKK